MIDFYFIYRFIRENFTLILILAGISFIVYINWDTIEFLYYSYIGKIEFFNDYHNNRK